MKLWDLEGKRQTLHLVAGTFFAGIIYILPINWSFLVLALGSILTHAFSFSMKKGVKFPLISWLVNKTERKGNIPGYGVMWFFHGMLTVFVIFGLITKVPIEFIAASILILAIGDSIATGLGRHIGKTRLPKTKTKSYEGTGVGFFFAFLGASYVLMRVLPFQTALIVGAIGAMVGMLSEAYLTQINDNLTIPVLSCSAMVISALLL